MRSKFRAQEEVMSIFNRSSSMVKAGLCLLVIALTTTVVTTSRSGAASATTPNDPSAVSAGLALQLHSGTLSNYSLSPEGSFNTQQGMMPGTSPAIAALPDGCFED